MRELGAVVYVIPLLPHIEGAQIELLLPRLVAAPAGAARDALVQLMHASPPPLPPAQLLLALHLLPTDGTAAGGVVLTLKQLLPAVDMCLAERSVYTMEVVAETLKLLSILVRAHLTPSTAPSMPSCMAPSMAPSMPSSTAPSMAPSIVHCPVLRSSLV